jgi:hypothetical protein
MGKICRWPTEKPSHSLGDLFRAHVAEPTKRAVKGLNTQLPVIPGGLTGPLQPWGV